MKQDSTIERLDTLKRIYPFDDCEEEKIIKNSPNLLILPEELLIIIFEFVPSHLEIGRLSSCCKLFQYLGNSCSIWNQRFEIKWKKQPKKISNVKPEYLELQRIENIFQCEFDNFKKTEFPNSNTTGAISTCKIIKNGERVLSSGESSELKTWNIKNKKYHNYGKSKHTQCIWSISASTDEDKLVSCCNEGKICSWDLEKSYSSLINNFNEILWKIINLDSTCIASSKSGGIFQIDFKTNKIINQLYPHSDSIFAIDVKDNFLLSGSADKNVILHDLRFMKSPLLRINQAHKEKVFCVQFLSSDTIFTSGGNDIKEWNISTLSEEDFSEDYSSSVWNFKCDASKLISTGNDTSINIFDTESGRILKSLKNNSPIFSVDYHDTDLIVGDYSLTHWEFF
eukprot:gene655-8156_t